MPDTQTVFVRDAADQEAQEEKSVTVRMAKGTFATEHGGRLNVNDLVDVAPSTARRWLRIGLAVDGNTPPIDEPKADAKTPEQIRAQIAALQAQLVQVESPGSGTPPNPFPPELAPEPLNAPDTEEHDLTEGAGPLGDVTDADDDEPDESPNRRTRRVLSRR